MTAGVQMLESAWWRQLSELDDAQKRAVDVTIDGKYLILGKPGSGKTNLVLLRAAYLLKKGYTDLRVLTMGRVLSEFIIAGSARHGLSRQHLCTFNSWAKQILTDAGCDLDMPSEYDDQVRYLTELLSNDDIRKRIRRPDALLLDEVQDYPAELARVFDSLSDRIFMAGDDDQRIMQNRSTFEAFRRIAETEIELPFHYRNGRKICAVASAINDDPEYLSTSRYDESKIRSHARLVPCGSLDEQVAKAVSEIKDQVEVYPNQLIGVIVPRVDDLDEVVDQLKSSEIADMCQFQTRHDGYAAFSDDLPVSVSSVHSAKGLEFRAVHFLGIDALEDRYYKPKAPNVAYTGVTRAQSSLTGYYTGKAPLWLQSAFNKAADELPTVTLEELFQI